jgi:hypothetical protein
MKTEPGMRMLSAAQAFELRHLARADAAYRGDTGADRNRRIVAFADAGCKVELAAQLGQLEMEYARCIASSVRAEADHTPRYWCNALAL